jgi:diguanylate cyclase (GGDEF)-like protein
LRTSSSIQPRQLRPLVVFSLVALLVLGVGVTLGARTLLGSFGVVERQATQQKAEQVYRAFEADLRQLRISNRDYAQWDDAEHYARHPDPTFIAGNFSAPTLIAMHVDIVWIVDAQGRTVFSELVDRSTQKATTPAPPALLEQLRRFQTTARGLREIALARSTLLTSEGLVAASATEISRSDHSHPTGAVMLFGRVIRDEEIQRVAETSRLTVQMTRLREASDSDARLPPEVRNWATNGSSPTLVQVIDDGQIAGYAAIEDVDGQRVAIFATPGPRDIYALGARTTWILLSSIVALVLSFGVTAILLLLRMLRLQHRDFEHLQLAEEQQRLSRHSLAKQAQQDALTGLPNRAYLNVRLPRLLKKFAGSDRLLAIIHLDVDHFKNVNDSRGHNCGDQLLQVLAKRLRATVYSHDLVARMGGDEFVVIASLMPDVETIDRFTARLQAAVSTDMVVDNQPMNVTASIGIAVFPRDGTDMETLFKHADIALFQAKEAGRSCHRFFASDMNARISDYVALEQALRHAIGSGEIAMHYQPIVDLQDCRVVSLEALMRWQHPTMGAIEPGRFIPVAEKSGLILDIGRLALQQVLAQQRAWLDAGVPIVPIAVNVSPLQLERTDFPALVAQMSAAAGVDPRWIRFEITESAMMKDPDKLVGALQTLRERGSQILVDDFGTGYSSLSYLDRLPVDILKIDRAFICDFVREGGHSPIVDAVIDMARRLQLRTVAEGVETMEQAALLRERGCDYAQGYFYSKPVSAEHCRSLLQHLDHERPLTNTMVLRVVSGG